MILSQTKIFNFFHGSVKALSIKILPSFASRYKKNYIPNRNFWINRLYCEISNFRQKQCLKIDTREGNELGAAKFTTQADSGTEQQICYYNRNKKDTCFNSFLAVRKETPSPFEINFSIVKVIDNTNGRNDICSETSHKLTDFKIDKIQSTIQQVSESDLIRKRPDRQQ